MKLFFFLIATVSLISCAHKHHDHPHIIINSAYGEIEAELYPEKAPKTVAAFISYIDSGYYKKSSFYRVLRDEEMPTTYNSGLIQGGVWPAIKNLPGIIHESTKQTGLSHTDGTLSLARQGAGTATTEFFICIGDKRDLDAGNSGTADEFGYAAFGRVVKGMDIVRTIQKQKSTGDHFDKAVEIVGIDLEE